MRLYPFAAILILILSSCSQQAPPPLTEAEKLTTQHDIRAAVNSMVLGMESSNFDSAMAIFADTPEFLMITTDGVAMDYKGFSSLNKEFFRTASGAKLITIQDTAQILASNLVLYTWIYSADIAVKTGEHYVNDRVAATFLFRKIGNRWMAVYFHESALPPALFKGKK